MTCKVHGKNCHPGGHYPGGDSKKGLHPFRPGKTKHDKQTGAWGNRWNNRKSDPGRNGTGK